MAAASWPGRVYGVDFSGSTDAGENIWITRADVEDEGAMAVTECQPASDWFDVSPDRDDVLPKVTRFLADRSADTVVGLDFPFGLPQQLVTVEQWPRFLARFPNWFRSPEDLRERCQMHAELVDVERTMILRETDRPLGALSPYDLRLQNQTFFGIRDVLRPLVTTGAVTVQPMQDPSPDAPSLVEVYPAGTLDELQLHRTKYKGAGDDARDRRRENVAGVVDQGITVPEELCERVLDDSDGDSLDSLLAAFAAFRNSVDGGPATDRIAEREVEGHIYV